MKARTLCATIAWVSALSVRASAAPDDAAAAYEAFEEGRRHFLAHRYEAAAERFERAHRLAPAAAAVANAIRSRALSRQPARAASLAVRAGVLYAGQPAIASLVRKTLAEATPKVQRFDVECAPACQIDVDGERVEGGDDAAFVVFLEPGTHELVARWSADRSLSVVAHAEAGERRPLPFVAPPEPAPPPPAPPPLAARPPPPPARPEPPRPAPSTRPLRPWAAWAGAGVTAALGGATVASYVEAKGDPGADRVRAECAGEPPSCPAYREGEAKEARTNALLVATAGAGALTAAAALFLTDWSARPAPREGRAPSGPREGRAPSAPRWAPYAGAAPGGAALGLVGAF